MGALISQLGVWSSLAVFAVAATAVLVAGTWLERYADQLGVKTGLGRIFAGMMLLAISTSLPEVVTTVTATLRGNVDMAVHNLLGSTILQTMMIAVADATSQRRPLTAAAPTYGLLVQGVGLIILLGVVMVAISIDAEWNSAPRTGGAVAMIGVTYVLVQWVAMKTSGAPRWQPAEWQDRDGDRAPDPGDADTSGRSLGGLILRFVVASAIVLVAGLTVVLTSESIAATTGLGTSFVGFTLVALVTSLPELSTTVAAARRGRSETAVANIFGSNALNAALLVLVMVLAPGFSIFGEVHTSASFAAGLAIILTSIYVLSMLERRDWSIARMGWGSILVLSLGIAGMGGMYLFTRVRS